MNDEKSSSVNERYRALIENAPSAILETDSEGRISYINPAACQLLGNDPNEILGCGIEDLVDDLDSAMASEYRENLTRNGRFDGELKLSNKNGRGVWVTARICLHPGGRRIAYLSELHKGDDYFRMIIEGEPNGKIMVNHKGMITLVNDRAESMFGYPRDELIGTSVEILLPERFRERHGVFRSTFLRSPQTRIMGKGRNLYGLRRDGTEFPLEIGLNTIKTTNGDMVLATAIDISARKAAEEELRESEQQYEALVKSSSQIVWERDPDGSFVSESPTWLEFTGQTFEESRGFGWLDALHPDYRQRVRDNWHWAEKNKRAFQIEYKIRHRSGEWRWTTARATPLLYPDGSIRKWVGMNTDVSDRKHAEESLLRSEERYRAFIKNASEGIWRLEADQPISTALPVKDQIDRLYFGTRIAEANDARAKQCGLSMSEELIGRRPGEFWVKSGESKTAYLTEFVTSGYRLTDGETYDRDEDGNHRFFRSSLVGVVKDGYLVRAWGVKRDITEIKNARQAFLESEEQLRRSQKVEALGRLAGGVAHDFNNFLSVIMLHVDMLSMQLPYDSPVRFRIEEIKSVTNRAAATVRQLLAFGRKQMMQPQPTALNMIATEFIKIIRPLIGEDIELDVNLDESLGVCFVDPDQTTQILMNLAVNARDAMPGGGVLRIETSNIFLNKDKIRLRSQSVGGYVQLKVSDTGVGMDAETRRRIFEPFFTTKEANKGTGLGLSSVYGIVKQSNGFIWVDSAPGKGTSFAIQFPRIDEPAKSPHKEEEAVSIPTGNETVLLVEDRESVRRATLEALTILGYRVLEADSGQRALEIVATQAEPIHLLLTDVVMPRMDGHELAEKVRILRPDTKVLFMSGYTDEIIGRKGALEGGAPFLSKPFTPTLLADKVRQALER